MKVTINGEVFDFDATRKPMSEALAIEHALKCRYAEWAEDVEAGSARAICGFIWLVWRRDGRDVKLEDILSGDIDIDMNDFAIEPDEGETDPTSPPPGASNTTAADTSPPSATTTSGRGRSGSSRKTSSTP